MYLGGFGVSQDSTVALNWFQKAADQNSPEGQFDLGMYYAVGGLGAFKPNNELALQWTQKSAKSNYLPAEELLAGAYMTGTMGLNQNCSKAYDLVMPGVKAKDQKALYLLGVMYFNGFCVSQDQKKAFDLFQQANNTNGQPYPALLNNLAWFYINGIVVSKNYQAAFNYYREGAEMADPTSQFNLAKMYIDGLGVPTDLVTGCAWANVSGSAGYTPAKSLYDECTNALNQNDYSRSNALANDLYQKYGPNFAQSWLDGKN